jgi:hypothetical protein
MRSTRLIAAIAISGAVGLAGVARAESSAATQPSSSAAMLEKVRALEERVSQLQGQQAQTQADVTAAINDMLSSADKRSKLFSAGPAEFQTGYDPSVGFVLQSADGNFSLHPGALFQFRGIATNRQSIPLGGGGETGKTGSDTQDGFVISRMRFTADGNVFSPLLTYFFQAEADNGAGGLSLLDGYFQYRVSSESPLALKFGQFKDPVWHEANMQPGNQMAVERSLANAFLGNLQDLRVQGVGIVYDEDRLRGQFIIHDGFNSQNTKFFDAGGLGAGVGAGAGVTPTNWGASVRAEYLTIGTRKPQFNPYSEYDQFSAMGDSEDILVLGGGADFSEAGSNHVVFHTLDAQYNLASGWGFYGAYLGAYRDINSFKGVPLGSYYDSGLILQGSYMLTSRLEPFARYDYTHLNGAAIPGGVNKDNIHEITVGANYYLYGQNAKFTIDGTWLPNGSPTDVDLLGVLKNDGHNEFLLRAQFQLKI